MKRLLYALLCAGLAGCACSSPNESPDAVEATHVPVASRDSAAYKLGAEHALRMLERATDTVAIADALLDVRARETDIRRRLRDSAADAYVAGFTDMVAERNPQLASEIF